MPEFTQDVSPESTGAVPGPPLETTYSGEIDLAPTGAYPNPPAETTYSQYWPTSETKQAAATTETSSPVVEPETVSRKRPSKRKA